MRRPAFRSKPGDALLREEVKRLLADLAETGVWQPPAESRQAVRLRLQRKQEQPSDVDRVESMVEVLERHATRTTPATKLAAYKGEHRQRPARPQRRHTPPPLAPLGENLDAARNWVPSTVRTGPTDFTAFGSPALVGSRRYAA
jgi:hypothetical protein